MMSAAAREGERRVVHVPTRLYRQRGTGRRKYLFETFTNGNGAAFYARTHCALLRHRPLFFAIDDDLHEPSASLIALHAEQLDALFRAHWGERAPWERGGASTSARFGGGDAHLEGPFELELSRSGAGGNSNATAPRVDAARVASALASQLPEVQWLARACDATDTDLVVSKAAPSASSTERARVIAVALVFVCTCVFY